MFYNSCMSDRVMKQDQTQLENSSFFVLWNVRGKHTYIFCVHVLKGVCSCMITLTVRIQIWLYDIWLFESLWHANRLRGSVADLQQFLDQPFQRTMHFNQRYLQLLNTALTSVCLVISICEPIEINVFV